MRETTDLLLFTRILEHTPSPTPLGKYCGKCVGYNHRDACILRKLDQNLNMDCLHAF